MKIIITSITGAMYFVYDLRKSKIFEKYMPTKIDRKGVHARRFLAASSALDVVK